MTRFKHYPNRPKKLSATFAKTEYQKLLKRLPEAEESSTSELWIGLFADWNALKSYIGSEGSRINHEFSKDMRDETNESADKYFREKVSPVFYEPEHRLVSAFLASKHRSELTKKYGEQLVPAYETELKPLDPINTKLRTQTSKLSTTYDKLVAEAMIKIRGEEMTLWKARSLTTSPDRALRKAAYLAIRGWFLEHHDELAKIYDKLVKIRHKMGRNVGYDNYIELAYQNMGRTDYDALAVKQFRDSVRQYLVPLNRRLGRTQARALKLKKLRPWDSSYDPRTTLPLGIVPIANQTSQARRLFTKLSPELRAHFQSMLDKGCIDLENRPGKKAGAYCTSFSDEAKVAVFCNSTGDADDIHILTHEMGHAFQGLESRDIEAVDLQWGAADFCEVHSTSMEFLSLPHIEEFFTEENADKFRLGRWQSAIGIICYVAVVDEFQHWVYENPGASIPDRDAKWCQISDLYLQDIDYSGYEDYQKTRWYMQPHIFGMPFYYIDYALAETVALQIAMIDSKNHSRAIRIYMKLCRIGGTKSFLKAIKQSKLGSPFEPKLIKELADHAQRTMSV